AWSTTTEDAYGGTNAIADSPIVNINNSGSTAIQMSSAVNLSGANAPRLEYAAKWGHENGLDRTRVQISTDGGSNWATLTTPFTTSVQGSQGYTGNETWIYESIDLSTYIGQSIQIRFATFANGSTPSDGFYFDNFRIVDYSAGGATPTCSDGIQNGDETGVDCGGSCPTACPTCSDGIQNGDETGVDCGGSCPTACPTCSDGIQNGDETGVDCGGSCSPCTGCNTITIISDDFEAGFGNWNDGGSDCFRSSDPTYANSGTYSVRLRDNTSTSVATTDLLDLSAYNEITVDFTYVPVSMDNSNEDFWLQISTNGGSSYTTVEEWNRGDEFENDIRYFESVVVNGPFSTNTRIRFRCDASGNADWVYLDDIVVTACDGGSGGGPTCTDGIQNGDETGVDCGGSCPDACTACNDGVQNGDETGVDCGGSCPNACPTCTDGIQNGDETGIDCGGSCPNSCTVSYCNSTGTSTFYEHIQAVAFDGNTNTSGNNGGYADFTGSVTFNALLNNSYSISLTPGFNGSAYNEGWSVWIDYNADGDFTDSGEQVFTGVSSSTLNGNISIPASATVGTTRMRVAMQYNAVQNNSCATFQYGEVEDYAINISSNNSFQPNLGRGDHEFAKEWLEAYPNPVSNESLTIRYGSQSKEEVSIRLIGVDGKVHRELIAPETGTLSVDISTLENGIYLLQMIAQEGILTRKIVVQ
ncbi:MAG: GEVED domain-containing protein, partial [Bacteroidota bacterium]